MERIVLVGQLLIQLLGDLLDACAWKIFCSFKVILVAKSVGIAQSGGMLVTGTSNSGLERELILECLQRQLTNINSFLQEMISHV